MASSKPLFPGDSEIDELFRIFRVRGTPNDHVWPGVSRLPNYKPEFPQWHEQRLDKAAPALAPSEENGGDAAIDLLAQMLTYAPARRITCRKALDHAFFQPPRLDRDALRGVDGGARLTTHACVGVTLFAFSLLWARRWRRGRRRHLEPFVVGRVDGGRTDGGACVELLGTRGVRRGRSGFST